MTPINMPEPGWKTGDYTLQEAFGRDGGGGGCLLRGPLLLLGIMVVLGLLLLGGLGIASSGQTHKDKDEALAHLPAPGSYDLSALPLSDRSYNQRQPEMVANSIDVSEQQVRVNTRWTNNGDSAIRWNCGPETMQAGQWTVQVKQFSGARAQVASLCTDHPETDVTINPGEGVDDYHVFARDEVWGFDGVFVAEADRGSQFPHVSLYFSLRSSPGVFTPAS